MTPEIVDPVMLRFNLKYFGIAILLLATEILIAAYAYDSFIRPYAGDFLVVIFLYALIKSCMNLTALKTAIGVLIFAYAIEVSQYFKLVKHIGLQHSRLANIILGNTFAWKDIIAYTLGIALVILIEINGNKENTVMAGHSAINV